MRLGIDWVSAGIFLVAFVLAQIRSIPAWIRYAGLSGACALIGLLRLRTVGVGANKLFVGLALGFAVLYGVRAMRALRRPE